jgi:addiction module RelE/StbE family toxin
MWGFWRSNRFKHRYRKMKKGHPELREKAANAIDTLYRSERPLSLGQQKTGRLRDYWTYDLDDDCRILYNISKETRTINLHRICGHTESYGR